MITPENYYSDRTHASCSLLKSLDKEVKGLPPFEATEQTELGRRIHVALLEREFASDEDRNLPIVKKILANPVLRYAVTAGECEVIRTAKVTLLHGTIPFEINIKGKCDVWLMHTKKLIDFKFMKGRVWPTDVSKIIDWFDYDLQAYIYYQLFGAETYTLVFNSDVYTDILKDSISYYNGRAKFEKLAWQWYLLNS